MQRTIKLILPALVLLFLCPQLAAQEEPKWESHGPYGGLVIRIHVDKTNPRRVLASVVGGSFISNDGGTTWKKIKPPKGVEYWQHVWLLGGKPYCKSSGTLYVSDDFVSWKKEAEFPHGVFGLTCEPANPDKKYCLYISETAQKTELYVSIKTEDKWKSVKIGELYEKPSDYWNSRIIISPVDTSLIRIVIYLGSQTDRTYVFGSDDGGRKWEKWMAEINPINLVFSPTEPKTIYATAQKLPGKMSGFLRSKDGGKTWESLSDDKRINSLRSLMFHPKTGHLFLGTLDKGLLKTSDLGKTLTELNSGLYNENISALAADPVDENVLYAGTQCGLFKSIDGGKNWKWISEGIAGCQTTGLVTVEQDSDRICCFEYHQGIRTSKDGGKTWSLCDESARLPGKAWSIWCKGKNILMQTSGEKPLTTLSKDMGKTWIPAKGLGEKDYAIGMVSDSRMFASYNRHYLYKSEDGVSWEPFAGPFKEVGSAIWWAEGPKGGKYILIVGNKGIVKCDAATGKRLGSVKAPDGLLPIISVRTFDPANPDVLYTANTRGVILKCSVPAQKWTKVYTHKTEEKEVYLRAFVFDPGKKGRLIAAFDDGYIVISEDSGKTWKPIKPESPFSHIRFVALTPSRKLVVAATGTVYTLDLSKIK